MKIFFRRIHLYLSLAAGLIIMVTCATGAILVFEKELQELFHPSRYRVERAGTPLSLETIVGNFRAAVPGAKVNGVKWYHDSLRTVEISFAPPKQKGATEQGKGKKGGGEGERRTAFMDPYTGKLIELYSYRETFFYKVMDLHRWMLSGDTGKLIVGISTSIFLFILLTGLILWWPKSRAILQQRLRVKFGGGWKRLNHDLHIVLGFYSFIFLFIFAFTGFAWSFEWFNKGIYVVTKSNPQPQKPPVIGIDSAVGLLHYGDVAAIAASNWPASIYYSISAPKDSAGTYQVNVLPETAAHESATDQYFIHPQSGAVAGSLRWSERNTGQRVRATFKPVHVASVYGTPSKIIGFIVCLFGASFPITGLMLWINRTRKQPGVRVRTAAEV